MKWLAALLVLSIGAHGQALDQETEAKALDCLRNGARYLLSVQQQDGAWQPAPRTAITALCVTALHEAPIDAAKRDAAIDQAMTFILKRAQDDGAIRSEASRHYIFFSDDGYPTYTTAVALLAMATLQRPQDIPYMREARDFLKSVQMTNSGDYDGGFGYKPGGRPDMSNTAWAAEAMYYSSYVEMEPETVSAETQQKTKEMWDSLDAFLVKAQNTPKDNENTGGFGYRPGMVSSGSMSYAGLKSMIYANVARDDARVKEVLNYLRETYSVDENPGQGTRGLYYYLQTMSKALDLIGSDTFVLDDGAKRQWREDLINKLAKTQRTDGSWVNDNGRYMESIKPLVTAYAMITLKKALSPSIMPQ